MKVSPFLEEILDCMAILARVSDLPIAVSTSETGRGQLLHQLWPIFSSSLRESSPRVAFDAFALSNIGDGTSPEYLPRLRRQFNTLRLPMQSWFPERSQSPT
jgi:hypothetical protein